MATDKSVRRLSVAQRDMLIDHIDRQVPIDNRPGPRVVQVRDWLMTQGYLRGLPAGSPRPTSSTLTQEGRSAVGYILGQYADSLYQAGLLDDPETGERPIDVLRRLKATRAERPDPLAAALAALAGLSGATDG